MVSEGCAERVVASCARISVEPEPFALDGGTKVLVKRGLGSLKFDPKVRPKPPVVPKTREAIRGWTEGEGLRGDGPPHTGAGVVSLAAAGKSFIRVLSGDGGASSSGQYARRSYPVSLGPRSIPEGLPRR